MQDMRSTAETIENRADFVTFVRALLCELKDTPAAWEHHDLISYLDALTAWVEDMDGYFRFKGEEPPAQPSWRLLGEMLTAARVYE